jgi:hypothetical protein
VDVTCLNLVLVRIRKKMPLILADERSTSRKWGTIPKSASPMKSMLHKKGGGSREDSDTILSNANCQGIEN